MKKTILFILLLLLCGCAEAKDEKAFHILAPTGAPALAFYDQADDEEFMTNSTPNNIISMMNSEGPEAIVIDTISGLKAIKNGAPYKLAATLTFGNFYLASTGNDEDGQLDPDDLLILFGENLTPDLLFRYLYEGTYTIEYVGNVQDAAKCLISGKNLVSGNAADYVFMAEPALSNALGMNENAAVIADIQKLYEAKSGRKLIQASLFLKNDVEKETKETFLNELEEKISALIKNPQLLEELNIEDEIFESRFGLKRAVAIKVLEKGDALGLGFIRAGENLEAIRTFATLFGLELDEEAIYR